MKNYIFAASYEWAIELRDAGCPIDYPDSLPRYSFRAEQLSGYIASCVYDTGYVIALRLATNRRSGTIITNWSFEPPWEGHFINWDDYEPEDIIPKKDLDVYKHLFKSPLTGVLMEGRLLRCGYPVEGILWGRSFQRIGESSHQRIGKSSQGSISAKISFTDDLRNTVPLCIDLNIDMHRSSRSRRHLKGGKARQPLSIERINPETKAIELIDLDQFASNALPAGPERREGSLPDRPASTAE